MLLTVIPTYLLNFFHCNFAFSLSLSPLFRYTIPLAAVRIVCKIFSIVLMFLSFLGTLFHQQLFVCDWWYNVRCDEAELSYDLNRLIGAQDSSDEFNDDFGGRQLHDDDDDDDTIDYSDDIDDHFEDEIDYDDLEP